MKIVLALVVLLMAVSALGRTAPVAAEETVVVSGVVFHDENGNGRRDEGEPGLVGWTISLYAAALFDAEDVIALTGADGTYELTIPLNARTASFARFVILADPPQEPAGAHWATTYRTRDFRPITDGIDVPATPGTYEASFGKIMREGARPTVAIDPRPQAGGVIELPPVGDAGILGRNDGSSRGRYVALAFAATAIALAASMRRWASR